MVICFKKQKQCLPDELEAGDCWIGVSLADSSGLILAARVGKHTDELIEQLVVSSEGKTACKRWNSDEWGGYGRVLPSEILHHIGKDKTQRLERTNGIVRQQTGRWHRRQNKFGKVWELSDCDNPISGKLLQLDLAAQSVQDNGSSTSWINVATLDLAYSDNLSHYHLMHYQFFDSASN